MKRKIIPGLFVLAGLTFLGFQKWSEQSSIDRPIPPLQESKASPTVPMTEKDIDRTLEVLKKVEAPSFATVAEELQASGDEEVMESFKDYQKRQKRYDAAFVQYETAHGDYRKAVHAASEANSAEVEAALAKVDQEAEALQTETEALNASSALFLEEYRRYTFEKFGLALN
ncbi:MAG TPA: hypothetical protein VE954_22930 [Oligoflexus sp.]|uniref:hypothetical protein n=1 Tax=Oligoflexus sp. TaxID=1971216 RepID=UPI002D585C16|nr:hypothetical protein [Oligoflexus sp.]HYX35966.1 hypothetical protein [Oligoflexus sp.]